MAKDRTFVAVWRQLKALGVDHYEIGILDAEAQMQIHVWSLPRVIKTIKWLKFHNLNGAHIYMRPKDNGGLVLLDDATQAIVQRLKDDGLNPACVVETSPLNFQVWIRFQKSNLDNAEATTIAQYLADHYGTDAGAASWRQFGRLGGFTNSKPAHVRKDGRFPFVLVQESSGKLAANAEAVITDARRWKDKRNAARQLTPPTTASVNGDAVALFRGSLKRLEQRYGAALNISQADWMIASELVKRGFKRTDIANAMRAASPRLSERKKGREDQYIALTLDKVFARLANVESA